MPRLSRARPVYDELLNETIRLEVGPSLPDGAFVRWRYDVEKSADQIRCCRGTLVVYRGSGCPTLVEFHRADKPCNNANHRSRFTTRIDALDDLPFPVNDIDGDR